MFGRKPLHIELFDDKIIIRHNQGYVFISRCTGRALNYLEVEKLMKKRIISLLQCVF